MADIKHTPGGGKHTRVNRWTGKMRGLAIIFLSAAALVVVRANPCQNNEDVYFPDPEGEIQTDLGRDCRTRCSQNSGIA